MAFRYWAAGVSGNWNSILSWSSSATGTPAGATVPGTADDVFFNAASGTVTATLDISPTVQTVNCTGFTGTLAFGTNTISLNSTGTVFTGATTMTVTGTPQIILTNSSATGRTISPTAVTEANSISFRITAGTGTLNINTGGIRDLDFTDGVNPTGYAGAYQNSIPTIYGNFKASTGMTKVAGTGTFTFAATSGTKTITTAAVVFDNPFTFDGVGGSWQLQGALTSGSTRTLTLTNGALDLNGYTLSVGIFASSNSNTRTFAFGTGNLTLTYASVGAGNTQAIWNTTTITGMTITGTPVVNCTGNTSFTTSIRQLIVGAHGEAQSISFNITPSSAASDTIRLATTNGAFKNVVFAATFTGTLQIANGIIVYGNFDVGGVTSYNFAASIGLITFGATSGTQNINFRSSQVGTAAIADTIKFGLTGSTATTYVLTNGFTQLSTALITFGLVAGTLQLAAGTTSTVSAFTTTGTTQKYLQSTTPGTQAILSAASGTNDASYLTIQDIYATGGATWNAFASNQNIDNGNNLGWFFSDQSLTTVVFNRRKRKRLFL